MLGEGERRDKMYALTILLFCQLYLKGSRNICNNNICNSNTNKKQPVENPKLCVWIIYCSVTSYAEVTGIERNWFLVGMSSELCRVSLSCPWDIWWGGCSIGPFKWKTKATVPFSQMPWGLNLDYKKWAYGVNLQRQLYKSWNSVLKHHLNSWTPQIMHSSFSYTLAFKWKVSVYFISFKCVSLTALGLQVSSFPNVII